VKNSISTLVDITKMVIIGSITVLLATGVGIALMAILAAQKVSHV